ncbi:hypothetical protein ACB098_04G026900 [Castanea mollissima]
MKKKNDELVIEIKKIVERPEIQSSKQCCIYKVPHHLRKFNEEAYTPQIISIGPFHHKKERLQAMEEHKERYFRSFVKRNKIDLDYLIGTIKEMEESIRGCYAETLTLSSDWFVKMVLVDASFILELLFRSSSESSTNEYPMFEEPSAGAIMLDLLLLENQLPFFVIEKVHHLAFPSLSDACPQLSNYHVLLNLSSKYFGKFSIHSIHPCCMKIDHFTDLLRTFRIPSPDKLPKRGSKQICHLHSATQFHSARQLRSATQLLEAGVEFVKFDASECGFDIKFENEVLKMPVLELDDSTEVVTRNIMALEQTRYIESAYYTDYFLMIDFIVNTKKDVDLLCDKGILVNYLGDNDAAKSMINNLNKGILMMAVRDDYAELCTKLNKFCDEPWPRWKATLKSQYFSTPWRAASTVAAIVLLVLTFIQTSCSIIQLGSKAR